MSEKIARFDYETFDGYYRIERRYWCDIKDKLYFEPVSPDQIVNFLEAYDEWVRLSMQDMREDLEDDGSLERAVEKLDKARKALEVQK
jgi:hypothetical protein